METVAWGAWTSEPERGGSTGEAGSDRRVEAKKANSRQCSELDSNREAPAVAGASFVLGMDKTHPLHPPVCHLTWDFGTQRVHHTLRGRNWMEMRGPTGREVLGTQCSQVR